MLFSYLMQILMSGNLLVNKIDLQALYLSVTFDDSGSYIELFQNWNELYYN